MLNKNFDCPRYDKQIVTIDCTTSWCRSGHLHLQVLSDDCIHNEQKCAEPDNAIIILEIVKPNPLV